MKYTHKIKTLVVSLIFTLSFNSPLLAGEETIEPLKEKSLGLAVVLGVDVIPGDALFYAGKSGQALGNIGLFLGGTAMMFTGFILALNGICYEGDDCNRNSPLGPVGGVVFTTGALALVGSVAWDLFGGVAAVKKHNSDVKKTQSAISNIQPIISVAGNGGLVGASFNF